MSIVCQQEDCPYWAGDGGCPCALLDVETPPVFCPFSLTGICPSNPQCDPGPERACVKGEDDS